MMFEAMLDDRYEDFYTHALAFNSCNERLVTTNGFRGPAWDIRLSAAFAIVYYRRPQRLLTESPERIWALEDRMRESSMKFQHFLMAQPERADVKVMAVTLPTHLFFWSLGKAAEDVAAGWPTRELKIECPTAELAELARPELKLLRFGLESSSSFIYTHTHFSF
jgi:hypothetical protein